jgi:16S rRNA (guanine1207-N2)-methyltransferase
VGTRSYTLETLPGVFSWEHVDAGTAALLASLTVRPDDVTLDVGCGCGILGLHAAALAPRGAATLVDVDLLATACAERNAALNGLGNVHVVAGDGLAATPGERYSLIVSNPPFHVGHAVDLTVARGFIHEAFLALRRRGRLVLVANRFLAYQQLMEERFGNVSVLSASPQYHVLSATHP